MDRRRTVTMAPGGSVLGLESGCGVVGVEQVEEEGTAMDALRDKSQLRNSERRERGR